MKLTISKLTKQGDTEIVVVEGEQEVESALRQLFDLPEYFVAIDGEVIHTYEEARSKVWELGDSEVLLGKPVSGG